MSTTIQTLPSFTATDLDGNLFSNSDLKNNRPIVLTYFNSGCDFCQQEAKNIRENIRLLNDVLLLLVSSEPPDAISNFAQQNDLIQCDNVVFLHDVNSKVASLFGVSTIPTTLIYNKDLQLMKIHKGPIKAPLILKEL